MKTFFIYLLLFFSIHSFAQETDLPEIIESAFTTKYPNANLDDWKSERGTYFLNFYLKSELTLQCNEDGSNIKIIEHATE